MHIETPRRRGQRLARLFTSQWVQECRAGLSHLPGVIRDPVLAMSWLRRAWAAPGVVAVLGLAAVYLLPQALSASLSAILPDVAVDRKWLGALGLQQNVTNPHIPEIQSGLLLLAWVAIGCTGFVLAMRRLPEVVTAGRSHAQTRPGSPDDATVVLPAAPPTATPAIGPNGRYAIGPNGRYAIGPELGRGGMGVVYSATDEVLDRAVAVKEFPRFLAHDATLVRRFQQEARSLARLAHPSIVQVYDLLEDAERLWMVIELVQGGDLASVLSRHGRMDVAEAARVGVQITEGLGYAHSKGVVHRDVKPANILLTPRGKAKIADFGIAKLAGSGTETMAGEVFGSPWYMSPEQASGAEANARSDIYSMGATLYEMLTGQPPFVADEPMAVLAQHMTKEAPSLRERLDDFPDQLDELIRSMLAKEPDERPRDMEETTRRLALFVQE